MRVICAWCEQEGKETLIGEVGLYDRPVTSHGICDDHKKAMLKQLRKLNFNRIHAVVDGNITRQQALLNRKIR